METHFIERFKDDLFVDPSNSISAKEAFDAARFSAGLVAACVIEKEHSAWKDNLPGKLNVPVLNCMSNFKCSSNNYVCQHFQGEMAQSPYGTLLPLSESIIVLGVQWNLSGRMNMIAVARNCWHYQSLINQMGTI